MSLTSKAAALSIRKFQMIDTPASAANLNLPDELIDRAYDVMSAELDHWQVVGPQVERRPNLPDRPFFTAVRAAEPAGLSTSAIELEPAQVHFQHFSEKKYAIAYVQWNGLKAVLADAEVQAGITRLGPDGA